MAIERSYHCAVCGLKLFKPACEKAVAGLGHWFCPCGSKKAKLKLTRHV